MAASAAGIAFGWKGSGWFFHTRRTLPAYSFITCASVGCARLQKGHWKSDHSTMVTGAVLGPLAGPFPGWTSNFGSPVGAPGAAWACADPPAAFTFSSASAWYSFSCFMPFLSRSSAFLICSSITTLNVSKGKAPEMNLPLMKNEGVPSAPTDIPYVLSLAICSAISGDSLSFFHCTRFRPACFAHSSYFASESSVWWANISACIFQNLSFPCRKAAIAAFAAGIAFWWKLSGSLRQTMRTSSLYEERICWSVGSTRAQNGHWKSDHSTMVTFGFFAPVTGPSPGSTLRACGCGAAEGGGAGGPLMPSLIKDS